MEAEDYARQLISKFLPHCDCDVNMEPILNEAKQCALICINEMIDVSDDSNEQIFLQKVKEEIHID